MESLQMQGAGMAQPPELGGTILASRTRLISVAAKLQKVEELLSSLRKDLREKNLTTTRMSEQACMWNPLISNAFTVAERVQTLLQLRQHGTDPTDAGPIYCSDV